EQAYRKRSGLPLLSDADIEALRAGVQMSWENGDGAPAPPSATVPATTPVVASPAVAAPTSAAGFSEDVQKWLAAGKKWSKSAIAAEQARRKRNNLPALTDAEVTALLGEPAGTAPVAATPAVTSAAPSARPAAAAGGLAAIGPDDTTVDQRRRRLVWSAVAAFLGAWFLAFLRFFLPRTLFEPNTSFKIGYPSDFALGVDTKFQQKYRIWVDRTPDRLFVIYARCTHLGCTPDWKPSENKFKCPCHGSGYDNEGINFEGPAPRPMDRAHVELAPDGQVLVDVSKLYSWPKGQPSKFNDPGAFLTGV